MTTLNTPQHIQDHENWVNASLPYGMRVCLHADRTLTALPDGGYSLECDYCPAVAVSSSDLPVALPAWYYTDPEHAPALTG